MSALSFNPNCGACGGLNSRGYCSYTACRFPVTKVTVITNQQTKTNADRIRAMTAEELADWLVLVEQRILERQPMLERPALYEALLDWLKQEARHE